MKKTTTIIIKVAIACIFVGLSPVCPSGPPLSEIRSKIAPDPHPLATCIDYVTHSSEVVALDDGWFWVDGNFINPTTREGCNVPQNISEE